VGKLCQYCNKREATMHFTDIKDGKKTELHLCKQCAQEQGPEAAFPSILSAIMKGGSLLQRGESDAVPAFCPRCGLSYTEFKAKGRLGCPACYDAFAPVLEPLLEKVHGKAEHAGRAPRRLESVLAARRRVAELETQLQSAIQKEDYEGAAKLRDVIRDLKGEPAGGD